MNDVLEAKLEKRNPFRAKDGSIRLAFCGKMKSGKDTAVNHLKSLHGGTVIHMFASGYRFVEWLMLYPIFGCVIDPDNKTKFERLMLQWIGHWGRVLFGKNIWLNRTLKTIAKTKGNVFVTGVRYPNEIKRLKEIEVQSVWVDRPESSRLESGAYNINHETETALDTFKDFDYKIPNDKDLKTFLRRVECYTHIGALLDDITDASLERQARIRSGLGAVPDNKGFFDDGVSRGWKPEIKDVVTDRVPDEDDRVEDLFADRKKWLDSGAIAGEIRRFADIVQNELYVTNDEAAVNSVRATLHRILDNRPITGEDRTLPPVRIGNRPDQPVTTFMDGGQVDAAYKAPGVLEGADKDTTLLEIRRLAKSIGIDTRLVVGEYDITVVNAALDRKEELPFTDEELAEAEAGVLAFEAEQKELERRRQVERAKRDRYNEARRGRRAEARAVARLNSFSRSVKRGQPQKKAAAKGRRK